MGLLLHRPRHQAVPQSVSCETAHVHAVAVLERGAHMDISMVSEVADGETSRVDLRHHTRPNMTSWWRQILTLLAADKTNTIKVLPA